ncbi:MAG TPA: hypothetical protein VIB82_03025 [Caulobacteraceae bacterium]|jgi:hypothetical protein
MGALDPMSPSRIVLFASCALALAGCVLPLNSLKIHKAGVSTTRPEGTIGPRGSDGDPPWQTYTVEVPSTFAHALASLDSTFHLGVTDCRRELDDMIGKDGLINTDGLIDIADVYINGLTLNIHSDLRGSTGPVVRGIAYLSSARIKNVRQLCFRAEGGAMFGVGFRSNLVRLQN